MAKMVAVVAIAAFVAASQASHAQDVTRFAQVPAPGTAPPLPVLSR
jgi:hypothetical protein